MDEEGISMQEFKEAFEKGNLFASGIGKLGYSHTLSLVSFGDIVSIRLTEVKAVDYGASVIVAKQGSSAEQGDGTDVAVKNKDLQVTSTQALAPNIEVGKRIPSYKLLNQSDARPSHLQELLKSNGRWRIITFTGDIRDAVQAKKLKHLGEQLGRPDSFLKRFTPPTGRYDDVFEVLVIHKAPRREVSVFDFPEVYRPYDEIDGWDYWKIFVDDESYHEGHGHIYDNLRVDPEGCLVVLRPDQYVSYVGPMDAYDELDRFFSGFMLPQGGNNE